MRVAATLATLVLLASACGTDNAAAPQPEPQQTPQVEQQTPEAVSDDGGAQGAAVRTYEAVTAGSYHSCAIAADRSITCWGSNNFGQAGAPAGTYKAIAAGLYHSCAIAAGFTHSCAIAADDTLACWGLDEPGQTEAPAGSYKSVADAPPGAYKFVAVGGAQSCAIASDDILTCWGPAGRPPVGIRWNSSSSA